MKLLHDNLTDLFNNFAKGDGLVAEIAARGFVYSETERKKILFVGINPSYPEGEERTRKNYSYKPLEAVEGYAKHYKKFHDIAENCGVGHDWTYMDLLYFRETDQNKITEIIQDNSGAEFVCEQLRLSIKLIEELSPDLIIVCNSGARQFFGIDKKENEDGSASNIWMGYNFTFDEKFGVDVITSINKESIRKVKSETLIGTPVLFTSTLIYMDASTKKRLEWQIKKILKYHPIFFGTQYNREDRLEILLKQLENLTEQIEGTRKLKNIQVKEQDYNQASELRDKEIAETKKAVEYILSVLLTS